MESITCLTCALLSLACFDQLDTAYPYSERHALRAALYFFSRLLRMAREMPNPASGPTTSIAEAPAPTPVPIAGTILALEEALPKAMDDAATPAASPAAVPHRA
jgi:hypothetical protein